MEAGAGEKIVRRRIALGHGSLFNIFVLNRP